MTPREAGPYPLSAIRPILATACLALFSCATDAVTRAEHAELLASLRALRTENARLETRVDRLESEKKVVVSRSASAAATTTARENARASSSPDAPSSSGALPPLTVVKLKPRKEAAPKLETNVEIAEPPEPITQEIKDGAPPDDADLAMAEAQFDRGLEMMKTGNSEAGVAQMQQFVNDWPRHPRADNAIYFSGMAFFAAKDFEHALQSFERVIAQYPAGDAVLDSMLKLADCRMKLKGPREARATWEKIVATYPGTAAATQAQARLHSSSQTPVASP
ncbi:MAG: tetratricopeptide repeat protein [Archangium sp.]|nr:tetratricopeptide repeat protein [Archangium sp.]MDP3574789.1 tetratricopeptide repeat protein [Archangium sp.]